MKNIHVLPTENSSRLSYNKDGVLELHRLQWRKNTQNIYITSDEEIKEGDYYIDFTSDGLKIEHFKTKDDWVLVGICDSKKIILTTDQDLIKDGVQAIDDEFLEWFVKNPSCEFIRVGLEIWNDGNHNPIIIIPKEEPKPFKQFEKLTEIEWSKFKKNPFPSKKEEPKQEPGKETADYIDRHIVEALVEVAKQKMYSEEDMKSSFQVGFNVGYNDEESPSYLTFEEWIKEYKKK